MHAPHTRTFPKEILLEAVRHLADKYPACFFEDPRQRRPLKSSIISDLEGDGATDELIAGADFYTRDWDYQRCLQAGAERVDLNGKKAGVVTEQEQRNARRRVREEKAALSSKISPVSALKSLSRAADDTLNKVASLQPPSEPRDGPAPSKPDPELLPASPAVQTAESTSSSPLARLQKLASTAAHLHADTEDETLRSALTVATLKLLADEARKVITSLEGNGEIR